MRAMVEGPVHMSEDNMSRMRIRELLPNLHLGNYPPGPLNSLTDVPGIKVSTHELHSKDNSINTGVTAIVPRDDWNHKACYAGLFSFNGFGEMTGTHLISEAGLLCSPIVLTGTFGIGAAHQGIYEYGVKELGMPERGLVLPIVAETFDGYLHDCTSFAVTPQHVVEALKDVKEGKVAEGNVGGGRGMVCHHFKGGTGSSSRRIAIPGHDNTFTLAALVQANYGAMADLRIGGAPVGRILKAETEKDVALKTAREALEEEKEKKDGSIIIVIATDAPLHPLQLQRIARRATVGLSRVGGNGYNMSGDIFLAFSTANEIPVNQVEAGLKSAVMSVDVLNDGAIDALFEGTADVTEEAIYNAVCMAETMVGFAGNKVEALPLRRTKEIVEKFHGTGE